jgi:ubiquinone/menaquinone biosynthesis C-methylase UbiE
MRDPREQFGPAASQYLSSAVHSNPVALNRLLEMTKPTGGIVADVATGAGHTAYAFAPLVDRVIATDITPSMLEVTRTEARKRGLTNLDVAFALAEALPFASSTLSGITCRLGAHHFTNVHSFVREARRALRPGGFFTLADTIGSEDHDADELVDRLERVRDPSHRRNYRRSDWLRMLAELDFNVAHEEVVWKEIDALDWMERMNVSAPDQSLLLEMMHTATGEFARYLHTKTRDGRLFFHLAEIALVAHSC